MSNFRSLALVSLVVLPLSSQAAITYDGFDYTVGNTLESTAEWTLLNTGAAPTIGSGSLTVDGLDDSTGNKVVIGSGNIQEVLGTLNVMTTGTVYFSFALNLTALPTVSTYSFGLAHSNTLYSATIWLQASGAEFQIGLANRSNSTPNYTTGTFALNETVFLVGSYTFNSGTGDDTSRLWINPDDSTFEAESGDVPAPTLTAIGGTDMATISQFFIRGATGSPSSEFDELRVGGTWADVTPVPEPAAALLGAIGLLGLLRRRR